MSTSVPSVAEMVSAERATFHYFETSSGVDNVTFHLKPGNRVLVLGRNGSGKSTLLSLIAGKHKVCDGDLTVLDKDAFDDTSLNADVSLIGPPWPVEAFFANTVECVASPAHDMDRRNGIAKAIHLPLKASIDKMSSGEKRRVQILFGLMNPVKVILLDECSTDIDVAERITVLNLVRSECEKGACCMYATHILDGIHDWATHVALVEAGRLVKFMQIGNLSEPLSRVAHEWMAKNSPTDFAHCVKSPLNPAEPPCIRCSNLSFRNIFNDVSFSVGRSTRTLVVGCNGSGKTTLLKLIAGKTFFANRGPELTVFNRACFQDTRLNECVTYCGDWWPKAPEGEMHVGQLIDVPLTERAEALRAMLRVNLSWNVHDISSGELKRVQLLIGLYEERPVLLMDEATADLDMDQRHALLQYLYEESVQRGVTVLYSTHIFEGLTNWATELLVLDRTRQGVHYHGDVPALEEVIKMLVQLKSQEQW